MYYRRLSQVLSTRIDEELVLLDTEGGFYHHMNLTGSAIWEALEKPLDINQLVATLRTQYGIAKADVHAEVSDFINELLGMGLIVAADSAE